MKTVISIAAVILLFQGTLFAAEQNIGVDEIIARATKNYSNIKTISGKYEREFSGRMNKQTAVAKFKFKKPKKMRISSISPYTSEYISNGVTCWLITLDGKDVQEISLKDNPQTTDMSDMLLVSPFESMKGKFKFERIEDYDNAMIIMGTPLKKNPAVSMAVVKVEPKTFRVLAHEIFDGKKRLIARTQYSDYRKAGNFYYPFHFQTDLSVKGQHIIEVIDFKRVSINGKIKDSEFEYKK